MPKLNQWSSPDGCLLHICVVEYLTPNPSYVTRIFGAFEGDDHEGAQQLLARCMQSRRPDHGFRITTIKEGMESLAEQMRTELDMCVDRIAESTNEPQDYAKFFRSINRFAYQMENLERDWCPTENGVDPTLALMAEKDSVSDEGINGQFEAIETALETVN